MKPFFLLDAGIQGNTSYLQKELTKCWENLPVSSSLPLPECTTPAVIVLKKVTSEHYPVFNNNWYNRWGRQSVPITSEETSGDINGMNCTERKLLLHTYYMICWSPGAKGFVFFQNYRAEGKYFPETEQLNQTNEKILLHLQLPWPSCPIWSLLLHISFTETEALTSKVLETETGGQITPLDATCILLSARNWGQRVADDSDMWRHVFYEITCS